MDTYFNLGHIHLWMWKNKDENSNILKNEKICNFFFKVIERNELKGSLMKEEAISGELKVHDIVYIGTMKLPFE